MLRALFNRAPKTPPPPLTSLSLRRCRPGKSGDYQPPTPRQRLDAFHLCVGSQMGNTTFRFIGKPGAMK